MLKPEFLARLVEIINKNHEGVATVTEEGHLKIDHYIKHGEDDDRKRGYQMTVVVYDDDDLRTVGREISKGLQHHRYSYLGHSPLDPKPEDIRRWILEALPANDM